MPRQPAQCHKPGEVKSKTRCARFYVPCECGRDSHLGGLVSCVLITPVKN